MNRHSWIAGALALLVLACAAGGWALLSGGGSGGTEPPTTVVALPGGTPGNPQPGGGSAPSASSATVGSSRGSARPRQAQSGQREGQSRAAGASTTTTPPPRLGLADRGQPIVWLRRGERIAVRATPEGKAVKRLGWRTDFGSRTVLAGFARHGSWAGVPTPLLPDGKLGWVKLDPDRLRAGWTRYSIDVDLSSRAARLRLGRRVVRSFRVTVGSTASPTPTGRFAITDMFRGQLNPAYGCCALATTATQPDL